MLSVNDNGKVRQYEYDRRGYPTRTKYADGTTEIRVPDNTGNLYETLNRSDRKYGRGGQLIKTARWEYRYDDTFHTHKLKRNEYKMNDDYHFSKANESLHKRFQSDLVFAASMEAKYPGIVENVKPGPKGGYSPDPSAGTTWHHLKTRGS